MDKQFLQSQRQEIQNKFNRAQSKWLSLCELCGKEYIDFQQTAQQLQTELKELEVKEQESKVNELKDVKKEVNKISKHIA